MRFVSTCAAGLEDLTGAEITEWGGEVRAVGRGAVSWSGSLKLGYRACLWSRVASRILLELAECAIGTADDLYDGAGKIEWRDHFGPDDTFAVDCTIGEGSPLGHSKFAALRVKDAIVDRFRRLGGSRPSVQLRRPDVRLGIHLENGRATLGLDLAGESLHRRGYRIGGGEAPLKENLAAAIVRLSGWNREDALVDPMCGSATLLIEAALLCGDSAPGLGRTYFGFQGWRGHDESTWQELVAEAIEREEAAQRKAWPPLLGYDAEPSVVELAEKNVRRAGLEGRIRLEKRTLGALERPAPSGHLLCNPPYGERLEEKETVKYLYRCLGNILHDRFAGWRVSLFLSNPDFGDLVRIGWRRTVRLFNGPLPCRLVSGTVEAARPRVIWNFSSPETAGDEGEFANRLRKNCRQRIGWAERQGIDCFRLYDHDVPRFAVGIDIYSRWIVVEPSFAPTLDPAEARERMRTITATIRSVLAVGRDRVVVRRGPQTKAAGRKPRKTMLREVREGDCSFLVDLSGVPGTGLHLNQRLIRFRLNRMAAGRTFLAIFDRTGTATVAAAVGGARETVSVLVDPPGGERFRQHLALNGLYAPGHRTVTDPVLPWLKNHRDCYDVIHVSLTDASLLRAAHRFDVPRDHAALLDLAMQKLSDRGVLLLVVDNSSFRPDPASAKTFFWRDLGREMTPKDFHRATSCGCWEICRRREGG